MPSRIPKLLGLLVALVVAGPARSDPALDQGIVLFNLNQDAEARALLTPLAKAQPPNASAAFHLGRIAMRTDGAKEAARWFEIAVGAEPANAVYYLWLGRAYGTQARRANKLSQIGLARKTKSAFERASVIDPENVDVRMNLVDYYLEAPGIVGGSLEKAKLQAGEIRKRNAYRGFQVDAQIAEHEKDLAEAERNFQAATRAQPDSLAARFALGNFYVRAGKYEPAFDTFEAVLAARPGEPEALFLLGRAGAISGLHLDRAEAALVEYMALPPRANGPPPAGQHWRLGMIHEKGGKKDLARAEYQKALAIDPKFEEAKKSLSKLK